MLYLLFLMTGWMLFMRGAVTHAAKKALEDCLFVLVPTLFPCMVLCLCMLRYVDAPPKCMRRLWRLLGLPEGSFYPFILGILGGYPTGARLLSDMRGKKQISEKQARASLMFCVNPSISFVLAFFDHNGALFYLCLILCDFILGILFCRREEAPRRTEQKPPLGAVFSESIFGATQSMLAVIGTTVFFSAVKACFGERIRLYGLDISSELLALGALGEENMLLAAWLFAFGGLSVAMQVFVLCDFADMGFLLLSGIKGVAAAMLMLLAQKKGAAFAATFGFIIIVIFAALKQWVARERWCKSKDRGFCLKHRSTQAPFRRQKPAPRFRT